MNNIDPIAHVRKNPSGTDSCQKLSDHLSKVSERSKALSAKMRLRMLKRSIVVGLKESKI